MYEHPQYHDIAFDWDISSEVAAFERMFQEHADRPVHRLLELGSGTGRFLRAFAGKGYTIVGLELNERAAHYATERLNQMQIAGARSVVGDMSSFDLDDTFDAAICSANTFRHLIEDRAITSAWRCLARHLAPGGIFVLDLELIARPQSYPFGKWYHWTVHRSGTEVTAGWRAVAPASDQPPTVQIETSLHVRSDQQEWETQDHFELRAYSAESFAGLAESCGFSVVAWYEVRFPWIFPLDSADVNGRVLAVVKGAKRKM